jgi:hypothetical protein
MTVDFFFISSVSEDDDVVSTLLGLVATMRHLVGAVIRNDDGNVDNGNRNPCVAGVARKMAVKIRVDDDNNGIMLTIVVDSVDAKGLNADGIDYNIFPTAECTMKRWDGVLFCSSDLQSKGDGCDERIIAYGNLSADGKTWTTFHPRVRAFDLDRGETKNCFFVVDLAVANSLLTSDEWTRETLLKPILFYRFECATLLQLVDYRSPVHLIDSTR